VYVTAAAPVFSFEETLNDFCELVNSNLSIYGNDLYLLGKVRLNQPLEYYSIRILARTALPKVGKVAFLLSNIHFCDENKLQCTPNLNKSHIKTMNNENIYSSEKYHSQINIRSNLSFGLVSHLTQ